MMSILSLQSLRVAIDGGEEDGILVLHRDVLVGVLVCLEASNYDNDQGHWHLEAGFGKCATRPTTFPKLEEALRWIAERLGIDPDEGTACAHAHLDRADGRASH